MSEVPFRFAGFQAPLYTPVPDALFDELLPHLTESELKVLLYIIRRTFGFKKEMDTISLKQMTEGIVTKDGRRLDHGAGISKTSAVRGVNGLVEKGIIVAVRNSSKEKGDQPTTYRLRFVDPVSTFETPPSPNLGHPPVPNLDPQETVKQETAAQEGSKSRKVTVEDYDKDREALRPIVTDFARELGDEAPLVSTLSRTVALYRNSALPLETFVQRMYAARSITQERSAAIKTVQAGDGIIPRKNKIPYFFKVLESLLGVESSVESATHENPAATRVIGDDSVQEY